jgi:hypothetical protein
LKKAARTALAIAPLVAGATFVISQALVVSMAPAQPSPPLGQISATCVENIPSGATRPEMTETFPEDGISGYASNLEIELKHGKGETVLPNGFKISPQSDASRALERSGFGIPDSDGGFGPKLDTKIEGDGAITKLTIPILVLPPKAGRVTMKLPSLPITVARADNEIMTLCTSPHEIVAEDPVASENDPQVKQNPPGRPQKEDWNFIRYLLIGILAGLFLGAIIGYFLVKALRKPKPEKVVPKRVPWVVALEELEALKKSTLLAEGKPAEYFDAVSDCLRKYLGQRYGFEGLGFDGLDTTTDEMRALLRRVKPPIKSLPAISEFLSDCDLVKFARLVPTETECVGTLDKAEMIVKSTMPPTTGAGAARANVAPPAPVAPPAAPPPEAPPPPPPEAHP